MAESVDARLARERRRIESGLKHYFLQLFFLRNPMSKIVGPKYVMLMQKKQHSNKHPSKFSTAKKQPFSLSYNVTILLYELRQKVSDDPYFL